MRQLLELRRSVSRVVLPHDIDLDTFEVLRNPIEDRACATVQMRRKNKMSHYHLGLIQGYEVVASNDF